MHALAVTTAQRAAALPEVPTVADVVPGFEESAWYALGAPKATPGDIVARLNREINARAVRMRNSMSDWIFSSVAMT